MTRKLRCCVAALAVTFIGTAVTANAQTAPEAAPSVEGAPPTEGTAAAVPTPVATTAPAAGASVTDQPGVTLGARLGYAIPIGSLAQNLNLSNGISGGIPIVLEGAYRINRNISVGLYGQYAYMVTKNCDVGASCSATDYRVGIEGVYNFRQGSTFDPWFGLGVGYEWLSLDESGGGLNGSATFSGWELATLQVGGDFAVAPQVDVGPFISFSIGKYGSASMSGQSVDIPDTAYHQWLQLGVRGTFNL
jgi:hypothetical protein